MGSKEGSSGSGDSSSGDAVNTVRLRRYHTRARTGCLTCRRRHVRCDEKRPSCTNCLVGKRACEYGPVEPTLRERRSGGNPIPGLQQPWATQEVQSSLSHTVWQLVHNGSTDPFDAFAVQMPLRSQELFHYFAQHGETLGMAPRRRTCIDAVVHDPNALRSTLLIAGLHYSWNTGGLQSYEPTFLFHKAEGIRTVNKCLRENDPSDTGICVRQILTLGFADCCLGNLAAAETHLNGLMAILEIVDPHGLGRVGSDDIDNELADRYLILNQNFLYGLKCRFRRPEAACAEIKTFPETQTARISIKFHVAQQDEAKGLEHRLRSLAKFPHFLAPPPPQCKRPVDIDATQMIECLREITVYIDRQQFGLEDLGEFFMEDGTTRLFVSWVDAHVLSFAGRKSDEPALHKATNSPSLMSSWCGVTGTTGLYLHSVMGIWNAGKPMYTKLLWRLTQIVKRHLTRDRHRLGAKGGLDRTFWFWKAFVGAMALATSRIQRGDATVMSRHRSSRSPTGSGTPGRPEELEALEEWFIRCVRKWSKTTNVTAWEEARDMLAKIAWPANFSSEPLAAALWSRAVEQ